MGEKERNGRKFPQRAALESGELPVEGEQVGAGGAGPSGRDGPNHEPEPGEEASPGTHERARHGWKRVGSANGLAVLLLRAIPRLPTSGVRRASPVVGLLDFAFVLVHEKESSGAYSLVNVSRKIQASLGPEISITRLVPTIRRILDRLPYFQRETPPIP